MSCLTINNYATKKPQCQLFQGQIFKIKKIAFLRHPVSFFLFSKSIPQKSNHNFVDITKLFDTYQQQIFLKGGGCLGKLTVRVGEISRVDPKNSKCQKKSNCQKTIMGFEFENFTPPTQSTPSKSCLHGSLMTNPNFNTPPRIFPISAPDIYNS